MDLYDFVEGPLLWIAFLVFVIGSILRAALFFYVSAKMDRALYRYFSWKYVLATLGQWLLPLNKTIAKNPVYMILMYVFHLCLIIVPIWLGGHVALWEESRFGWSWATLPDAWTLWMTRILLTIAVFLLLRRMILPDLRLISTASDYILLIVTALPFLTGHFLTHGYLDSVGFMGDHMKLIHILSGELMLIVIPFTKLSHFILFFFSRGSTAIEFGRRGYSM